MSESNIDLIQRMLDRDVEKRYSIEQVMEHEWCKEVDGTERDESGKESDD